MLDRTTNMVRQDGRPVAKLSDTAPTASGIRIVEANDIKAAAVNSVNGGIAATNDSIPVQYRAGPLGAVLIDRSNSPKLEVHNFSDSATDAAPYFDDFVLEQKQEQDVEKMDVVETFGVPHLFASGRYVRRFNFSGRTRTAPPNYASDTPALKISQTTAMRVFYDRYLRASAQADAGQYTRLVVDGQYYTGYVVTLNTERDAHDEQWSHFTFSMIGTKRDSDEDRDAELTLSRFQASKKPSRFLATQAKAELSDALGTCELTWLRAGSASTTLNLGNVTIDKEGSAAAGLSSATASSLTTGGKGTAFSQNLSIMLKTGTPQRIDVTSDVDGVVLTDASGGELHGLDLKIQEAVSVALKVIDFAALWANLQSKGKVKGSTATTTVNITVSPAHGNTLTAQFGLTLTGTPTFSANPITVALGANPASKIATGAKSGGTVTCSAMPAADVLTSGNSTTLLVTLKLTEGVTAVPPAVAATARVSVGTVQAQALDNTWAKTLTAREPAINGSATTSAFAVDAATGSVSFLVAAGFNVSADLRTTNPFKTATQVELRVPLQIDLPGYDAITMDLVWPLNLTKPAGAAKVGTNIHVASRMSSPQANPASYRAVVPYEGTADQFVAEDLNRLGHVTVTLNGSELKVGLDDFVAEYKSKAHGQTYGMGSSALDMTTGVSARLGADRGQLVLTLTLTTVLGYQKSKSKGLAGWLAPGYPPTLDIALAFPPGIGS